MAYSSFNWLTHYASYVYMVAATSCFKVLSYLSESYKKLVFFSLFIFPCSVTNDSPSILTLRKVLKKIKSLEVVWCFCLVWIEWYVSLILYLFSMKDEGIYIYCALRVLDNHYNSIYKHNNNKCILIIIIIIKFHI